MIVYNNNKLVLQKNYILKYIPFSALLVIYLDWCRTEPLRLPVLGKAWTTLAHDRHIAVVANSRRGKLRPAFDRGKLRPIVARGKLRLKLSRGNGEDGKALILRECLWARGRGKVGMISPFLSSVSY